MVGVLEAYRAGDGHDFGVSPDCSRVNRRR
jgi:hypothetical protein